VVTSGQFLIDSEASMRASLNRMSDDKESDDADMSAMKMDAESKIVSGSGVILAIKTDENTVNLQHEPIEDLGWPAMTMDFSVMPDVDLSKLSVNESVMFQLEKHGDSYMIISIHVMEGEM
jgi:membrane fusion protein, copper/silver efflux system